MRRVLAQVRSCEDYLTTYDPLHGGFIPGGVEFLLAGVEFLSDGEWKRLIRPFRKEIPFTEWGVFRSGEGVEYRGRRISGRILE